MFITIFNISSNASGLNLEPGVPTSNYYNQGSVHAKGSNTGLPTSMYRMRSSSYYNSKEFLAYCIESQIYGGNYAQSIISMDSYRNTYLGRYQNKYGAAKGAPFNIEKMRAIMLNSMPAMDIYQVRNAAGISGLTQQEAVRATQYALWNQTDNLVLKRSYSYGGGYYASMPTYRWDNYYCRWVAAELNQSLTSNEVKYYNYLVSLQGVGSSQTVGDGISDVEITQQNDGTSIVKYNYDKKVGQPRESISGGRIISRQQTESNGRIFVTLKVDSADFTFAVRATVYQKDIAVLYDECGQAKIIVTEICKEICKDNKVSSGCFDFYKKDKVTGALLPGAEFTLYDANGNAVKTAVSGNNGVVVFDGVPFGNYTMKETKAPNGYSISDKVYNVQVKDREKTYIDGQITRGYRTVNSGGGLIGGILGLIVGTPTKTVPEICVTIYNEKVVEGCFNICKIDSEGNIVLSGAVFELRNADGSVVATQVTNANGALSFMNIKPGTYTLVETKAPEGYQLSDKTYNVVVDNRGTVTIDGRPTVTLTVKNDKKAVNGNLKVLKIDVADYSTLQGAVFELRNADGSVADTQTTDANGVINFANIKPGTYTLVETKAPDGYKLPSINYKVEVDNKGVVKVNGTVQANITICNEKEDVYGNLKVLKIDVADYSTLQGAIFELRNADGSVADTQTTDANGAINFANIKPGKYTLVETKAPDGYKLPSINYAVEVDKNGVVKVNGTVYETIVICNEQEKEVNGNLKLNKVDSYDNSVLPGAVFELRNEDGTVADTQTTDANGTLSFADIKPGTYTLAETKAPDGYELSTTVYNVVVDSKGVVSVDGTPSESITVKNDMKTYDFEFVKLSKNEYTLPLEGAYFEMSTTDGTLIQSQYSDYRGLVKFTELRPGKYIVSEPIPMAGYLSLGFVMELTISKDGQSTLIAVYEDGRRETMSRDSDYGNHYVIYNKQTIH